MRRLLTICGLAAALAAFGSDARASEARRGDAIDVRTAPIAPLDDRDVGYRLHAETFFDDHALAKRLGGGAPVYRTARETVAIWIDAAYSFGVDDDATDIYGVSVGPSYRLRLSDRTYLGANLFLDVYPADDVGRALVDVSLGLELERVLDAPSRTTLRFGMNGYLPFDDYSDVATYGRLSRFPQFGLDAYMRYGGDVAEGVGLNLTLGLFGYAESDDSGDLFGASAMVGLDYWRGLPDGVALHAGVGPRLSSGGGGAMMSDASTDLMARLGVSYAFGGRSVRRVNVYAPPPRSRVASPAAPTLGDALSRPKTVVGGVEKTVPGAAPVRPVRRVGFETAPPIARR